MTKNTTKRYLKEVKKALDCKRTKKLLILNKIRESINEFSESDSVKDYDEFCNSFGTPTEIAKLYASEIELKKEKNKFCSKKKLLKAVSVLLLLLFLSVGIFGNIGSRYGIKKSGKGGAEGRWIADLQREYIQIVADYEFDEGDIVELGQNMEWTKRKIATEYTDEDGKTIRLVGEQKWGWSDNFHWAIVIW